MEIIFFRGDKFSHDMYTIEISIFAYLVDSTKNYDS